MENHSGAVQIKPVGEVGLQPASTTANFQERLKVIRGAEKSHWRQFREVYPRSATCVVLGIAVLLLINAFLLGKSVEFGREQAVLRASLTRAETERADAIAATEHNLFAMTVELARRETQTARGLHLAVDCAKEVMYLQREGAVLREMPVLAGPEATVGIRPDTVRLALPRGKRVVVRVVDDSHPWEVPEWVYLHRGLPVPGDRRVPGALGPLAIVLDGGALIYSLPGQGPLSDPNYLLPGSIRALAADLEAIRADLQPGMTMYFY